MASEKKTVVLLGKNGIGKSSVGNVLLGEKKFKTSLTETGGTKVCQIEESDQLVVVDTPGFFSSLRSDVDTSTEIIGGLQNQKYPIHVFILVLSVDPLFTGDEDECLEFVKILVGEENINNNMIVVFTRKDSIEDFRMNEYTKPRCLPDVPYFIINCRDIEMEILSSIRSKIEVRNQVATLHYDLNDIRTKISSVQNARKKRLEPNISSYKQGLDSMLGTGPSKLALFKNSLREKWNGNETSELTDSTCNYNRFQEN